jgi:hypothetical protein
LRSALAGNLQDPSQSIKAGHSSSLLLSQLHEKHKLKKEHPGLGKNGKVSPKNTYSKKG